MPVSDRGGYFMKRTLIQPIIIVLLAFGLAVAPSAASADAASLVSTAWLVKNIGAPNLVVIDVRTDANYAFAHLPGAVSLPYFTGCEVMNKEKMCRLMPTPPEFSKMMRSLGVNQSSHVVIYDQGNTISDATQGTSATWVMEAMGVENVSYLDGGFTKWTFEGRKVVKTVPAPQAGSFTAKPDMSKVATLDDVIANLKTKKAIFLDARSPVQHFGASKEAAVMRFGHIPGSLNFPAPFMSNAGANRAPATIKSSKELEVMARGVGLPADRARPVIVYCNSAQFAGMGYFVLHDILGYRNVKVYDGSMLEYAQHNLPLVKFAWGFVTK